MSTVEDIEDLWKNDIDEKRTEKNVVKINTKKKCCGKKETCCSKKKNQADQDFGNKKVMEDVKEEEEMEKKKEDKLISNVPGHEKIFFKTYGC